MRALLPLARFEAKDLSAAKVAALHPPVNSLIIGFRGRPPKHIARKDSRKCKALFNYLRGELASHLASEVLAYAAS
jgi:hypothetical protein